MRIVDPRDLALSLRARRRELGMTQSQLAKAAGVSRRWLSDLETGKSTAEVGLVLKVVNTLGLVLDARPELADPAAVDIDEILRTHSRGDP
jgi:HTH-type transcriptional regulator / antitoxin HipB